MRWLFDKGNFNDVRARERNDWVIGHYKGAPRDAADVCVKWGVHDANSLATKPWAACRTATTLGILIAGAFHMDVLDPVAHEIHPVSFSEPGDFVLFGPGIPHKSEAFKDGTVFLTVRWPSVGAEDTKAFDADHPPTRDDIRRLEEELKSANSKAADAR